MGNLKTKWCKRMAVVMAFALTVASVPGADAQAAKKAKLAKTRLTIKVGKKKTIKIKNKAKKAKYTFKSKKASIAKVSKKGVVTARKAGSTTITVKEKSGKKTRKLGNVRVTVKDSTVKTPTPTTPVTPITPAPPAASDAGQGSVTNPTDVPVVTGEPTAPSTQAPGTQRPAKTKAPTPVPTLKPTPSADPYTPKGKGWQKLDLSEWSGSKENYLETGGQIVLSNVEAVSVPIPTGIENIGDEIEVLIRGSVPKGSKGFRYWLTNAGGATMTTMGHYSEFGEGVEDPRKADEKDEEENPKDPKEDLDPAAFKDGDFQIQRVLTHINKDNVSTEKPEDIIATKLLLKASAWGGTLDGTTITGIWVRYGDDIGNEDDPITPPTTPPGNESSSVESPDITKPENNSYTIDFAKGYRKDSANEANPTVVDGVITANFTGGYVGFHYVLPDEADLRDAKFKYVTVTYKNPGDALNFYLYNGDTDLKNPDISGDCKTKKEIGKLEKTDEEKTATFSWDGNTVHGFQVFGFAVTTELEITSVVFSEKEPGSEEPGTGEEDPGPAWTTVDMSKVNAGTFDSETRTLTVKEITGIEITLSENLPAAGKLEVKLVGTDKKGSLFRCWAGGNSASRTSDVAMYNNGKMFGTFVADGSENNDFNIICNLTLGAEGEKKGEETKLLSLVKYNEWEGGGSITGTGKIDDIVFTSISYRIVDEFTNN